MSNCLGSKEKSHEAIGINCTNCPKETNKLSLLGQAVFLLCISLLVQCTHCWLIVMVNTGRALPPVKHERKSPSKKGGEKKKMNTS